MQNKFSYANFVKNFPNDDKCLEEIVSRKYPGGMLCTECRRITQHYKIKGRQVYSCKFCRSQVYPLTGTLFEKSSTPLKTWFLALFIMTQTRAKISIKSLQKELKVTYKTAWRIYNNIYKIMKLNKGDLLNEIQVNKWVLFNAIELKVVTKT